MKSIFQKVSVKKKDVPEDGEYDTNLGMIEVFCGKWVADEYPEWYLKEITLPTKDEIEDAMFIDLPILEDESNSGTIRIICEGHRKSWTKGAKWFRDKIFK